MNDRVAVVLMAYGTPLSQEEIEPYYTDIRRGRAPTAEALADLTRRYSAIGGVSPLAQTTEAQCRVLQAALDANEPGRYEVTLGLKHADPRIEDAATTAANGQFSSIVGLVLAPHFSAFSVGQYLDRLQQGVAEAGQNTPVAGIMSWATVPAYIDFLANDLAKRLAEMRSSVEGRPRVLFTAHSLPERIIAAGDPYADELRSTAQAVAQRLGLTEDADWQIAWQSAGRTPEAWLGPDILQVIDELGSSNDVGGVIVCACGFVADHLEVLYDLDIEAAQRADAHDLAFDRTASVNTDAKTFAALAELVCEASNDSLPGGSR
ncbi:MAG: ferrochelatase [Actinobacteria bacterium]|nr:MAG: ferrochelatase [Actinomycetota bacterium]